MKNIKQSIVKILKRILTMMPKKVRQSRTKRWIYDSKITHYDDTRKTTPPKTDS